LSVLVSFYHFLGNPWATNTVEVHGNYYIHRALEGSGKMLSFKLAPSIDPPAQKTGYLIYYLYIKRSVTGARAETPPSPKIQIQIEKGGQIFS